MCQAQSKLFTAIGDVADIAGREDPDDDLGAYSSTQGQSVLG